MSKMYRKPDVYALYIPRICFNKLPIVIENDFIQAIENYIRHTFYVFNIGEIETVKLKWLPRCNDYSAIVYMRSWLSLQYYDYIYRGWHFGISEQAEDCIQTIEGDYYKLYFLNNINGPYWSLRKYDNLTSELCCIMRDKYYNNNIVPDNEYIFISQ